MTIVYKVDPAAIMNDFLSDSGGRERSDSKEKQQHKTKFAIDVFKRKETSRLAGFEILGSFHLICITPPHLTIMIRDGLPNAAMRGASVKITG